MVLKYYIYKAPQEMVEFYPQEVLMSTKVGLVALYLGIPKSILEFPSHFLDHGNQDTLLGVAARRTIADLTLGVEP